MKFKLTTAGYRYSDKEAEWLSTLGFKFNRDDRNRQIIDRDSPTIEFTTIDELMAFLDDIEDNIKDGWNSGGRVIVSKDEITIYDSYVE